MVYYRGCLKNWIRDRRLYGYDHCRCTNLCSLHEKSWINEVDQKIVERQHVESNQAWKLTRKIMVSEKENLTWIQTKAFFNPYIKRLGYKLFYCSHSHSRLMQQEYYCMPFLKIKAILPWNLTIYETSGKEKNWIHNSKNPCTKSVELRHKPCPLKWLNYEKIQT